MSLAPVQSAFATLVGKSHYLMLSGIFCFPLLALKTDERVETVYFTRIAIVVDLIDGRTISVPIAWYPKLLNATQKQKTNWEIWAVGMGFTGPISMKI